MDVETLKQDWPVGLAKDFGDYDKHLRVRVIRDRQILAPKFNSVVEQFKLNFLGSNESGTIISDTGKIDFENFRQTLHNVFNNLLDKFRTTDGLICQINIYMTSLLKKYIKSGLFLPNQPKANSVIDFLVNQLIVSCASDDQLSIDGQFRVDFLFSQDKNLTGCQTFNVSICKQKPLYYSQNCKKIFMCAAHMLRLNKSNNKIIFLHLIKYGIIDLSLINVCQNNKSTCIESSIAFSVLNHEKKGDTFVALKTFCILFNQDCKKLINYVFENDNIIKKHNSFHDTIQYYSKLLNRNISILSKIDENNINSEMRILFTIKSKHNKYHHPIHLLYSENIHKDEMGNSIAEFDSHVSAIFEVNLLKKNGKHKFKKFCVICNRDYTKAYFLLHKCYNIKCIYCLRYLTNYSNELDIFGHNTCFANGSEKNNDYRCNCCNSVCNSVDCLKEHKNFACKYVTCCTSCSYIYRKNNVHFCGNFFCRICLKLHDHGVRTCFIRGSLDFSKSKTNYKYFIFFGEENEKNWLYFFLCEFKKNFEIINSKIKLCYNDDLIEYSDFYKNEVSTNVSVDAISSTSDSFENSFNKVIKYLSSILVFDQCSQIIVLTVDKIYKLIQNIAYFEQKIKVIKTNSVKFNNIIFKNINNYIDIEDFLIAEKHDINSAITLFPKKIDMASLIENKCIMLEPNDFDINNLVGSSRNQFKQLHIDRENILKGVFNSITHARKILFHIINCRIVLYKYALKNISQIFEQLLIQLNNLTLSEKNKINNLNLFDKFGGLNQAAFALMKYSVNDVNIPSFYSVSKKHIKNSSKCEIIFCKILALTHNTYCNKPTLYFMFSDNGQFSPTNCKVSADFYCSGCSSAYFVCGTFKMPCELHGISAYKPCPFNKSYSIGEMESKSYMLIKYFSMCAGEKVKRTFKIGTCCINDTNSHILLGELRRITKNNVSDVKKYVELLEVYKQTYNKNVYEPISYQNCIQTQLIYSSLLYAETNNVNSDIIRLDINSAYMSSLQAQNIRFPSGERRLVYGCDAQSWFDELTTVGSNRDSTFAAVKAEIYHPIGIKLPFFSIMPQNCCKLKFMTNINIQKTYFNSDCQACVNYLCSSKRKKSPSYVCKHTIHQRKFIKECLLEDVEYAQTLGYHINILQAHIWESAPKNNGLVSFSKTLLDLTSNEFLIEHVPLKFLKYVKKRLCLSVLGKYATNIDRLANFTELKVKSKLELSYLIKQKRIVSYDFKKNKTEVICIAKIALSQEEKDKMAKRASINPLIFASSANLIHRRLHTDALKVLAFPHIHLVRCDVDSLTMLVKDMSASTDFLNNLFYHSVDVIKYKQEYTHIKKIASFSKRSYCLIFDDSCENILKTCGLSLCNNYKFNQLDVNAMFEKFKNSLKDNGFQHFSRANPPNARPLNDHIFINQQGGVCKYYTTTPYGFITIQ